MPRGRIAMHWMKDVLRLHHECGRSQREVARSCGVSVGTVNGLLRKARGGPGLGWPLPEDLDEQQRPVRSHGAVVFPSARVTRYSATCFGEIRTEGIDFPVSLIPLPSRHVEPPGSWLRNVAVVPREASQQVHPGLLGLAQTRDPDGPRGPARSRPQAVVRGPT